METTLQRTLLLPLHVNGPRRKCLAIPLLATIMGLVLVLVLIISLSTPSSPWVLFFEKWSTVLALPSLTPPLPSTMLPVTVPRSSLSKLLPLNDPSIHSR